MLNEALRWRGLGVSCIPTKGKIIDMKMIKKRGYHCRIRDMPLPTKDDLTCWFGGGKRNLAIITGAVICVDFDAMWQYYKFKMFYPHMGHTMTVETPAVDKPSPRCFHLYFWLNNPVDKPIKSAWPDVELKHSGMPVVTCGSGYELIDNGLLSKYNILRLENIFALPIVMEVKRTVSPTKKKSSANFSFRGCQGSVSNPIKTIKSNLSISRYLADLGHELKPLPNNRYITNCPIHNDEKPSFWIDENTSTCNCYRDDCKRAKSYDVLDLHQRLNSCNLSTAINQLANSLGF